MSQDSAESHFPPPSTGFWVALALAWGLLALATYWPALSGPLYADDLHYIARNPYVREPSLARTLELLAPRGEATHLVGNYAPVHVLLHALEWQLFGADVRGYHVVNVLLHTLNAMLLVALLGRAGVSRLAAVAGGLFFLLHPANVEAVAWVSQLKTVASLTLALLALLWLERRPAWATAAFGLGLLTKATAGFALPVAAAWLWVRRPPGRLPWLGVWALGLAAFGAVELAAVWQTNLGLPPAEDGFGVRLRSGVAIAGRYLVMAATSLGVSAFHEPPPARSWADPWWLAGLVLAVGIGLRTLLSLRRRREEAAWWIWALAGFLPVSQLVPFRFPMGDRYLYPILPGLIGAALLATAPLRARLARAAPAARGLGYAALALALTGLGLHSYARAELWAHPPRLLADAAAHYPDGVSAWLLRAREAAAAGNTQEAVAALRRAYERGFDRLDEVFGDRAFAGLQGDPAFEALLGDMAARWIERLSALEEPSQAELYALAVAHRVRGEVAAARRALERALEHGGPLDAEVRAALAALPPAPGE